MKPFRSILLICLAALLAGCNLPEAAGVLVPGASETPFQPVIDAQPEAEEAVNWWLADLPQGFRDSFALPSGENLAGDESQANLRLAVNAGEPVSHWVYAVAAPFPTLVDGVTLEEIKNAWEGKGFEPSGLSLLMSADTRAVFTAWWGEPADGSVRVEEREDLLDAAWASQPITYPVEGDFLSAISWAIIPFEDIEPKWKVLTVDGQSPLWKDFDAGAYPLVVPIGLSGDEALVAEALPLFGGEAPLAAAGNRDADKLATVVLTGVTALVRSTAWEMNRKGITYPAEDIGELLREADIAHISNEVPFAEDCPPPDPVQRELIFCSDPAHIELLAEVGADVIELTGDHFNDWGAEAMLYTLELYKERGWPYYGGGANADEARQPLKLEVNGNQIAFIGCNAKRGSYASARADYPGAVACDYDLMEQQVRDLAAEGYIVIATFQHFEYYSFLPQPDLVADFERISAAGASIVSGSQAHQTHGLEFPRPGGIIMYGLGNLFFDQKGVVEFGDQALIARHVIYDGRYIGTELFTIEFVDYAKPRFMTAEERDGFLPLIFNASRW